MQLNSWIHTALYISRHGFNINAYIYVSGQLRHNNLCRPLSFLFHGDQVICFSRQKEYKFAYSGEYIMDSSAISEGTIIGENWKVVRRVSSGEHGEVHTAKHLQTGRLAVAKVGFFTYGESNTFAREINMYVRFARAKLMGFPEFIEEERYSGRYVLIMEEMGTDIRRLLIRFEKVTLPLDWVMQIGRDVTIMLCKLHSTGFIHCDIAPENIVVTRDDIWTKLILSRSALLARFGKAMKTTKFSLIDFGLCQRVVFTTGEHIAEHLGIREGRSVYFRSHQYHTKMQESRKHDLESLMYVLTFLYLGNLPWSERDTNKTFAEQKSKFRSSNHYSRLPLAIRNVIDNIWSLRFDEAPNYKAMIRMLSEEEK